jgi:xylose dehydrogenase (NAD/NADP)
MDIESYFDGFERRDWQHVGEGAGTLRVAMVGLGWWTTDRAMPAVEASAHCETTVVVSGSTEKAERIAREEDLAAALSYEEFQDGAASEAYDAAYVCTPNATHMENAVAMAEHGTDVLCEKPMAASPDRAAEMVAAFEDADAQLMIAYRMQTEPAIRRARELVREGFVGDPLHVHGHMSQRLLEMIPDPDQWRLNSDLAGRGGSVTDLGIYSINTARFVMSADPVAATAQMRTDSEGFGDIPDERAVFTLTYDNGAVASMSASQNTYRSGHLKVTGSEGELTVEPAFFASEDRTLELHRNGIAARTETPHVDQMEAEFEYFADRVLRSEPVHPDGEHGLLDMRALEAVYDAAETGERVEIGD